MKIQTHKTNTEVSGDNTPPRTFAIQANSTAFATLSSGLYNDKIRAIIRELACNAWDAHVMAGKSDAPFDIHLPTELEPFFRITDYGIGLSDADVLNLYCTYFSSNKSESNDVVGAMGLGSKSPFCYTQSMDDPQGFTVVSRYQGMKRIYSAYVENGAPTIVRLSEETTNEPNGLEIQFAVNTEDVWEFENKAKMALEFFNPKPNINREDFEIERPKYILKGDFWGLRAKGGLRAIQGMVQYDVGSIDYSRLSREQGQIYNLPFDLFFSIGELSVAASRESLSNDQRTVEALLTMFSNVHKDVVSETRKKLDACKTAWEARLLLQKIRQSPVGSIVSQADFDGQYTNFNLSKAMPALSQLEYTANDIVLFSHTRRQRAVKHTFARNFQHAIPVQENVVLVFNDLVQTKAHRHANTYTSTYVQNTLEALPVCRQAYLFTPVDPTHTAGALKEFKKAVAALGDPDSLLLSQVAPVVQPLLPVRQKVAQGPRVTGVLTLTKNGRSRSSEYGSGWLRNTWTRTPVDELPTGGKFYIPVLHSVLVDEKYCFRNAESFVEFLHEVKLSKLYPSITGKTEVFGLPENSPLLKNKGEWVNILDYIETEAANVVTPDIIDTISIHTEGFHCPQEDILKAVSKSAAFNGSPIKEFAKAYTHARGDEARVNYLTRVIQKLQAIKACEKIKPTGFGMMWKDLVVKHYPMLGFVDRHAALHGLNFQGTVLDYIQSCDAQRSQKEEN